jgi:hypothetical protein
MRRRVWEGRKPDPAFCHNHQEVRSEAGCDDCRCRFCAACVVRLQGRTLCGPCKNFRIRGLNRPSRVSGLAIAALVFSLVSGPVTFVLTFAAVGVHANGGSGAGVVFLCVLGLALPACGLVLAWLALRQVETRPGLGGRSLAAGGAAAGLAGALWAVMVAFALAAKGWHG